jgi:hypothetical protein
MGTGAIWLFIGAMLWLALWHGRARLLGLVPAVAAAISLALLAPPDVLITGDGRHVGIVEDGTLVMLREAPTTFTRQAMLESAGMAGPTIPMDLWKNATCNADFCRLRCRAGVARGPSDRARQGAGQTGRHGRRLCGVDIVIAQERIYAPCHPRAMKIDEPVLYRTGASRCIWRKGASAPWPTARASIRGGARLPAGLTRIEAVGNRAATLLLIDAGGTISSQPDAQGRLAGSSGGLGALGEVVTQQVYAGLSEEMTFADMARVRDAVLAGLADSAIGGVIVAHGTDAMEETAFLTDLALGSPAKPVIFTGAMLPISYPGSDAPANLANALLAARSRRWQRMARWWALAGTSFRLARSTSIPPPRSTGFAGGWARPARCRAKRCCPRPAGARAALPGAARRPLPDPRWRVVTTVLPSRLHWTRAPRGWC